MNILKCIILLKINKIILKLFKCNNFKLKNNFKNKTKYSFIIYVLNPSTKTDFIFYILNTESTYN